MPVSLCIKHTYRDSDIFDMFVSKMFDVTCVPIQRLGYNIRDVVLKNHVPLAQIAKINIDLLIEITDIMDRVCIIKISYNIVILLSTYI